MDLQEDEELEALRMAALATLKSHSSKKNEFESTPPDNISKVSTVITSGDYSKKDASDLSQGSVYGQKPSWRNSQSSRRDRGRQFPKGNQRSNLIVITPVNLCEKTDETKTKETLPQLVLPQHKWCQSVNEDSSSPKSYRRVGPSRFNRHGSDSESSDDSDYDNSNSDNDSYSNDTVLQDEPSEPFSGFTPEENTEDERQVRKQQTTNDRQLSFHSIDSQEKEKESVLDSRKDTYSNSSKAETKTYKSKIEENDLRHAKEISDNLSSKTSFNNESITKVRSKSPIQFKTNQSSISSVNGGLHSKKDDLPRNKISFDKESCKYSRKHSEKHIKTDVDHTTNNSRNLKKNLSDKDLRYELKKRMLEKPLNSFVSRSRTDHSIEQNRNPAHLRRSPAHLSNDEDSNYTYKHKLKDCRSVNDKSEPQSYSSSENEHSGSPNRHSRLPADAKNKSNHKREHSRSLDKSHKRSRSQSLELNRGLRRHSRSSSSSSSSSSSKSSSTSPRFRLVSSVVKPITRTIESKTRGNDIVSNKLPFKSTESRRRNSNEKQKFLASAVKSSVCESEKHVNAPDAVKRVPVHMRLGTLPHKRIIRMTKDVEAAFVCTSSDEDTDVNMKFKKQNYRVVTELSGNKSDEVAKRHVEKGTCRNVDVFKGRRLKIER